MNSISRKILCWAGLLGVLANIDYLYANPSTATQSLEISIPKVALVKLDNTKPSFSFNAAKNMDKHTSRIALSSNDRNAHLSVEVKGVPRGLQLDIEASADVCKGSPVSRITADNKSFRCLVGMARTRSGQLTLTGNRSNLEAVPDGSYPVEVLYTLSD